MCQGTFIYSQGGFIHTRNYPVRFTLFDPSLVLHVNGLSSPVLVYRLQTHGLRTCMFHLLRRVSILSYVHVRPGPRTFTNSLVTGCVCYRPQSTQDEGYQPTLRIESPGISKRYHRHSMFNPDPDEVYKE